jgi:hypothetical protein
LIEEKLYLIAEGIYRYDTFSENEDSITLSEETINLRSFASEPDFDPFTKFGTGKHTVLRNKYISQKG